jgi:crotonobetainyl-CoA:carnitine CoA-transferase CaiB-like acyl-CoA transferase
MSPRNSDSDSDTDPDPDRAVKVLVQSFPPAPLDGLRVLDLSSEIAGPYCTKLLADAGADVLKVEHPDGGDPLRRWSATDRALGDGEPGVLFRFLNTSKRSAAIDYTTAAGRAQVLDLAAGADIVVDSFVPGRLESLGLDPPALWSRQPRLTWVSISAFGRGGPWSERAATEFTLQALCGSTAARGTLDRPPIAAGGRLGEWLGGTYAAVAALTAWHGARRDGRGEHVDLSLLEVMALTMAPNTMVWESLAGQPGPFTRTVEIPSIEPARDGWIGFCTITAQQWRDFLVLIERSGLVDDEVLARWDERLRRAPEVNAMIHAWTRAHGVDEIVARAVALRIPVAAVGTGETVATFDHFVARGAFIGHPGADFVQPRPPYRLSDATLRPLSPAPRLGADTPTWQPAAAVPPHCRRRRRQRRLARRAARHRLHRLLGRPVRRTIWQRWAPTSSRSSRSSAPTACASRACARRAARIGGNGALCTRPSTWASAASRSTSAAPPESTS